MWTDDHEKSEMRDCTGLFVSYLAYWHAGNQKCSTPAAETRGFDVCVDNFVVPDRRFWHQGQKNMQSCSA